MLAREGARRLESQLGLCLGGGETLVPACGMKTCCYVWWQGFLGSPLKKPAPVIMLVDFSRYFLEKKPKLLNDKVNKGLFSPLQRTFTLLFQYVICCAVFSFCFTLLETLTLHIFIRELLLITAVWQLFNKFADFAANQMSLSRGICEQRRSASREKPSKEIFR